MSDAFDRGARLFDAGRFFEAHEAWEERWKTTPDPVERRFLQGLIQVAAAFHKHLAMRSPAAAQRLFARGLAKLDACPPRIGAMDLATFREKVRACAADLNRAPDAATAIPSVGSGHGPHPGD
jgi:uncharacterized protein